MGYDVCNLALQVHDTRTYQKYSVQGGRHCPAQSAGQHEDRGERLGKEERTNGITARGNRHRPNLKKRPEVLQRPEVEFLPAHGQFRHQAAFDIHEGCHAVGVVRL